MKEHMMAWYMRIVVCLLCVRVLAGVLPVSVWLLVIFLGIKLGGYFIIRQMLRVASK